MHPSGARTIARIREVGSSVARHSFVHRMTGRMCGPISVAVGERFLVTCADVVDFGNEVGRRHDFDFGKFKLNEPRAHRTPVAVRAVAGEAAGAFKQFA